MDKVFDPKTIERTWRAHYESEQIGKPSESGSPFCIMIPPPNVTGTLHMGHGFQLTLMDTLIRYKRMKGHNTLWQMGTDHAGIATQMVVERQLAQSGQSKASLGRSAFIDAIWDWKKQSGDTIKQQIKRMGASVDWEHDRFTLDPAFSKAVTHAFVQLHRDGLVYRGHKLVNWDPKLQTAISDLEVKTLKKKAIYGTYNTPSPIVTHISRLPLHDLKHCLGTDIAVSPDDTRFQHLIGKTVQIPLTDKHMPVIADTHVDPAFGTGCVKVTPAHDFNDYAIGQRHDLPMVNILQPDGTLNHNVPQPYQGLSCADARTQVITDLEAQQLLLKTEPHTLTIPVGDRSGAVIEPYLTPQWFVKTEAMAQKALDVVKDGRCTFHPKIGKHLFLLARKHRGLVC